MVKCAARGSDVRTGWWRWRDWPRYKKCGSILKKRRRSDYLSRRANGQIKPSQCLFLWFWRCCPRGLVWSNASVLTLRLTVCLLRNAHADLWWTSVTIERALALFQGGLYIRFHPSFSSPWFVTSNYLKLYETDLKRICAGEWWGEVAQAQGVHWRSNLRQVRSNNEPNTDNNEIVKVCVCFLWPRTNACLTLV